MYRILGAAIMVFLVSAGLPGVAGANDKTPEMTADSGFKQDTLKIVTAGKKEHSFKIEVAETQAQREKGLQGRTEIAEGYGMLFIYPEDTFIQMWMKDTPLSLDMLFLDSKGEIIHIAAKTKPESTDIISTRRDARGVFEVLGGTAEKLGIKVGDKVVYSYFQ